MTKDAIIDRVENLRLELDSLIKLASGMKNIGWEQCATLVNAKDSLGLFNLSLLDPYPRCIHCNGSMIHTLLTSYCSSCGFTSTMDDN